MKGSLLLLSVTALALNAHAASLAGFYQFNDSTNLGLDSSGNHNDLTAFGTGVSYTSAGKYGGGLDLTASGGLSTTSIGNPVPSGFPLGNQNYTISLWFDSSISQSGGFIGWGAYGSNNEVNALRLNGSGFSHYWWADDLVVSATTNDSVFHNVTVTFDGTTRKLYFDGSVIGSNSPSGTHNAQSENFAIGLTNGSEYFNGILDNVAVFNGALDATQVNTVASGDLSAFGVASAASAPEPASIWMMLGAGAALLYRRRRP